MYQIGEFAKRNNVSIHTLRYYDNIGILKAHKKDEDSTFRYYTDDDERILKNIHVLQKFGFSIDDIAHFSREVVERKLKEIETTANYFIKNMYFLQNLLWEENMENLNFEELQKKAGIRTLSIYPQGQWLCMGTTNNWYDIFEYNLKKSEDEMGQLYFAKDDSYTETVCNLREKSHVRALTQNFELNNEEYGYLIHRDKLIVWKQISNKENKFYCYRNVDSCEYTLNDIDVLMERYAKHREPLKHEADEEIIRKLLGEWEYKGSIKEKDISDIQTPVHNERAGIGPWKPHYAYLKFNKDRTVQTMKDGEVLNLMGLIGKQFDTNRTMGHFDDEGMDTIFGNPTKIFFIIKKINGEDYLFLQDTAVLHEVTLNENYWFYTRVK